MPTVQSNGINLYYETHGEGQPLLLIHGLGSSTRDWEFQLPPFAVDATGLLRALAIDRAHVVGVSLGGGIAFQLAVDAPQIVKTLVIVNSAPELVVGSLRDQLAVWQRLAIVRLLGMRKMGELLSKRLFVKPEHTQLRERVG